MVETHTAEIDAPCGCGRGPVAVCAFKRNTSLLIRRIGDMGHASAADHLCIDCVADLAAEVAACPVRPFHPDFATSVTPPEQGGADV